jgi:DNA-binding response OmpR family regulator
MLRTAGIIHLPPLVLHSERWQVWWKSRLVPHLTRREFLLVEALASRPDVERDRVYLADAVHIPPDADIRALDQAVRRTRRKFEAVDPDFCALRTVYGIGYLWSTV